MRRDGACAPPDRAPELAPPFVLRMTPPRARTAGKRPELTRWSPEAQLVNVDRLIASSEAERRR